MKNKIFVFCNRCVPGWHVVEALTADGCFIASHICSHHAYIDGDMGFTGDWKHAAYDRHYPDGWELVRVEQPKEDSEFQEAYRRHCAWGEAEYAMRMAIHAQGKETAQIVIESTP